jgi:hypothetical protein
MYFVVRAQRFEVAEAVRVAVRKRRSGCCYALVEVVAQAQPRMENWARRRPKRGRMSAGHEVEHVLEIRGARLLDGLLRDDRDPAGGAVDLLARLLLGAGALGRQGARLDEYRWERRRRRGLGGGSRGEENGQGGEPRYAEGEGHRFGSFVVT